LHDRNIEYLTWLIIGAADSTEGLSTAFLRGHCPKLPINSALLMLFTVGIAIHSLHLLLTDAGRKVGGSANI